MCREKEPEDGIPAAPLNLDADISPEEMQMMQSMGIPFGFNTTQASSETASALSKITIKSAGITEYTRTSGMVLNNVFLMSLLFPSKGRYIHQSSLVTLLKARVIALTWSAHVALEAVGSISVVNVQGQHVEDDASNTGGVKLKQTRRARQYMNRKGGFNRALPSERSGATALRD